VFDPGRALLASTDDARAAGRTCRWRSCLRFSGARAFDLVGDAKADNVAKLFARLLPPLGVPEIRYMKLAMYGNRENKINGRRSPGPPIARITRWNSGAAGLAAVRISGAPGIAVQFPAAYLVCLT
jgi:hypothetical protein